MAITKMDHVSILAKNSEKTADFYKEILGFREKSRVEIKMMHMRIIMLEARGDKIEIIEPLGSDIKMSDGLKHIAFESDDIEADFRHFKEKGAIMLHKEIQKHEDLGLFFAKSPSGEFIEVIQHF